MAQPYAPPPPGAGQPPYASWGRRVLAYLVDAGLPLLVFYAIGLVVLVALSESATERRLEGLTVREETTREPTAAGVVLLVLAFLALVAFGIWNQWLRQGRTGRTVGKQWVGIRLVREHSHQPPGVGLAVGRSFARIADAAPCYVGLLWPLWDPRRQTFADKICSTVVLDERRPVIPGPPRS